jgi:RHS repeat-associated protein
LTAVVNVGVSRGTQALEAGDAVRVRVIADGDLQRTVSTTVTGDTLTDTAHTVSVDDTSLLPATSLTVELSVVSGVIDTNANGAVVVRVDAVNVGINTPDAADTFTYDKAGRMVSRTVDRQVTTLQWDVLSNLVGTSGKGGTRWYLYDASGQRVAQVREASAGLSGPVPGTATVYVGSSEASDTDTGKTDVGLSATRYYSIGGATVATLHLAGGVQTWSLMLGDTQGSAQVMVDLAVSATASGFAPITSATTGVTRTAYMPYGSGRGTSHLSIDRGWLGQVQDDDTGLVYLNARYYDPILGRFLSPDPLLDPDRAVRLRGCWLQRHQSRDGAGDGQASAHEAGLAQHDSKTEEGPGVRADAPSSVPPRRRLHHQGGRLGLCQLRWRCGQRLVVDGEFLDVRRAPVPHV